MEYGMLPALTGLALRCRSAVGDILFSLLLIIMQEWFLIL
jgi:hypothetical protein